MGQPETLVPSQAVPVDTAATLNQDPCRMLANKCHAIHSGFAEIGDGPAAVRVPCAAPRIR